MSAWQPIETAPKDGELILLAPQMKTGWWEFGDETWLVMNVPLNDNLTVANDWRQRPTKWFCVSADIWTDEQPTHWMPLPEPPGSAS